MEIKLSNSPLPHHTQAWPDNTGPANEHNRMSQTFNNKNYTSNMIQNANISDNWTLTSNKHNLLTVDETCFLVYVYQLDNNDSFDRK